MPRKKSKKTRNPAEYVSMKHIRHDTTLPASVGLVKEVRSELLSETQSIRHEIGGVRHEVDAVRHEMGAMEKRLKGDIEEVKGEVKQVLTMVHKTDVLMEEQRNENRIVLDGLKTLSDRQDRVEETVRTFDSRLNELTRAKHPPA